MSIKLGSTAIKALYLGANELKKIYLGSNLVYQKVVDTEFSSCPFPTTWIQITSGIKYKATNDYGEWNIEANSWNGSDPLYHAFDGNVSSTYYRTNNTVPRYTQIELPDYILIKPNELSLTFEYNGSADEVQGYNPTTNEWETIGILGVSSSKKQTKILNYTGNTYFSKFRLYSTNLAGSGYTASRMFIYEFQIISGTLRKQN